MSDALRLAVPTSEMSQLLHRVLHRLKALAAESGEERVVLPVGIFLLIDKANGGDATAQELAARFNLLDFESRNVIDFYFLGWRPLGSGPPNEGVRFDLDAFSACRDALRQAGISKFGGNADLLLVDAIYEDGRAYLDFSKACRIDLSRASAEKTITTLGSFLQSVIEAAEAVASSPHTASAEGVVFSISDRLGLVMAKNSILEFFLKTWGKVIGAERLALVAVRDLGPKINLADLR